MTGNARGPYSFATRGMSQAQREAWWKRNREEGGRPIDPDVPGRFMCAVAPDPDRRLRLQPGENGVLTETRIGEYYHQASLHGARL